MNEILNTFLDTIKGLWLDSGFNALIADGGWKNLVMIGVALLCMYLAIAKQFEPLLLLPISFGMLLTNLPFAEMYHPELWTGEIDFGNVLHDGGLLDILYLGVKLQIYPPLIFLGIGCMTDFSPLIANPKSFLLGAAAQAGIFFTFVCAGLLGFNALEAASIAIIGGADGPTAIYVSSKLLTGEGAVSTGNIALAAYTYMALVPVIQPPLMRLFTTKKERAIKMEQLRVVSKTEKIIFPIAVTLIISLLVPSAAPLVGMLMFGNLLKESGVADRLADTAANSLINIVTIALGLSVGSKMSAELFLTSTTLAVLFLGVIAFGVGTASGVLMAKLLNLLPGAKINPLIGSAGISAIPMAARVSHKLGQEENPNNHLLMHAMGANVSGSLGSAIAAGILLALCS